MGYQIYYKAPWSEKWHLDEGLTIHYRVRPVTQWYKNISEFISHVNDRYKGQYKFKAVKTNLNNMARKRPRKTQGTKVTGKLTFSSRTRSGKGTVKGYVTGRKGRNAKSIVVSRTSYRTRNGQRRVLEIVTTKKVIKA